MIKVTICSYDGNNFFGGPFTWLKRIVPIWQERGIEVRLLFFTYHSAESCPSIRFFKSRGVPCTVKRWLSRTNYHDNTEDRARWILKELKKHPPDIFVPNLVLPAFFAARWVRKAGIPTVGILHSDDSFYHSIVKEFVLGRPEFRLSAAICVSNALEKFIKQQNPENTRVVKIPYYIPIPPPSVRPVNDKLKLVYAGRLIEKQKQISRVAKALCRVVKKIPHTEAYIFGDGPDRANVEKIIHNNGANVPIHMMGVVQSDKLQKMYKDKHVFVLMSKYEGLPIALLEAMAAGMVPVCFNIRSGVPELICHNKNGLLIENDNDAFISAIKILQDQNVWNKMSKAARSLIESSYGTKSTVYPWIELYESLKKEYPGQNEIYIPRIMQLPPINKQFIGHDRRKLTNFQYVMSQIYRTNNFLKRKIVN